MELASLRIRVGGGTRSGGIAGGASVGHRFGKAGHITHELLEAVYRQIATQVAPATTLTASSASGESSYVHYSEPCEEHRRRTQATERCQQPPCG